MFLMIIITTLKKFPPQQGGMGGEREGVVVVEKGQFRKHGKWEGVNFKPSYLTHQASTGHETYIAVIYTSKSKFRVSTISACEILVSKRVTFSGTRRSKRAHATTCRRARCSDGV